MRDVVLTYTYEYPWHVVAMAYQRRFENLPHPKISSLVSAEMVSSTYNSSRRELQWEVLAYIEPPVSTWIKRLSGVWSCAFKTENSLNFAEKTLTIHNTNGEYRGIAVIEETNVFRPHDERDDWTTYTQHSKLVFRSMLGLQGRFEDAIMKSYQKNYEIGRQVDLEFIREIDNLPQLPRRGHFEQLAVDAIVAAESGIIPFTHDQGSGSGTPDPLIDETMIELPLDAAAAAAPAGAANSLIVSSG